MPHGIVESVLGIKMIHLAAGLFGGLARALIRPRVTLLGSVGSATVGAITAAYLTPIVALYLHLKGWMPAEATERLSVEHAVGFALGLAGMSVCEGIILRVRAWKRPRLSWPRPPDG